MIPAGSRGGLNPSHQLEFDRRTIAANLLPPQLAQPVLGADAAREPGDHVMNNTVDLGGPRQEIGSRHGGSGTLPPASPVLPPWGTIATPAAAASATTRATSFVSQGRATQHARPVWSLRQSTR
jgi:hypothetical protein